MRRIKPIFRAYNQLTKSGLSAFVLLTASAGYFLSLDTASGFAAFDSAASHFAGAGFAPARFSSHFSWRVFLCFLAGLYLVSAGGFILNQAQEWRLDRRMRRSRSRPIARGNISPLQGYILAFGFLLFGHFLLILLKPLTAALALLTVLLYNGFYTLLWKKYLSHGAVLGALPGALPPVIAYSLGDKGIFSPECVYLFVLMFLWQMPHFWSLAIRYREDYRRGGAPVLPVAWGVEKTIHEMGFYTIAYLGLALISPLFLRAGLMYLLFLPPLALKIFYEFYRYAKNPSRWLKFFLWVNASLLVCLFVPVADKWLFYFLSGL